MIFMFMHGGPSHLDTFDPKPLLDRDHGKPLPFKRPLTFAEGAIGSLLKSPWQFRRYGQSGLPVSELFPNVAPARRRSVRHALHGGRQRGARRRGAAASYRLQHLHPPEHGLVGHLRPGTENQNLPAYMTIKPGLSHGGAKNWSSGFLPAAYQGTAVGHGGMSVENLTEPIEHLKNKTLTTEQQRYELDMLQKMNRAECRPLESGSGTGGANPGIRAGVSDADRGPRGIRISKESRGNARSSTAWIGRKRAISVGSA